MTRDTRRIDPGVLPTRYARGWHCLGLTETFRASGLSTLDAFGTQLVVVADGVRRAVFQGDGRGRVLAGTRPWVTCEQNKQLFVWHDVEGNPPIPEQAIPEIEGIHDGEWSDWAWSSLLIEGANCRELIDNNTDMAHFFYVHFAYPTYFRNVFEGHMASQFMSSKARPDHHRSAKYDLDVALLRSEASYFGPAYMIDHLENDFGNGFVINSALINCHYPVTQTSFVLQWGVAVKNVPGIAADAGAEIARKFSDHFGEGFRQDVAIWQSKVPVENPLLCEEDGPVYQNRRWYRQFYVDVADIEPEMTTRFEFEVDTSHANEVWRAEVADNLQRTGGPA